MTEYIFKNDATCYLLSSVGVGDTTIYLQSGNGSSLPSPSAGQAFHLCLSDGTNHEWVVCTGRSSDTLTVTRASSPKQFDAGDKVYHMLHEDALNNILQKGTERTVTSDPDGVLAASYSGEEVYNSVTGVWWKHCTSTTWKAMNL